MIRIYYASAINPGGTLPLPEAASHHLIHVLRVNVNQPMTLFNGQGGEYEAVVIRLEKRTVTVEVRDFHAVERESPLKIHLGQSISRGEKMDWSIQKAVELGVAEITPVMTERCGVQLSKERWEKRLDHWQKIMISAAEQCGRNTLPCLHPVIALTDWIAQCSSTLKIVMHPAATLSLSRLSPTKHIELLAGPEGGFSEPEIEKIKNNGFQPIRLGPRVLRTETAALAAITALQTQFGDFLS